MSATSEYESSARQDYGPATPSESIYEHVLDHKLTDMNVQSIRTPVLRAVPLPPSAGDPEPDSTNPENPLHVANKLDKEVEYHIAEKRSDTDMSVDSLSGLVRIEETTIDSVGRLAYPIIQETDDDDGNYIDNSSATLIQGPLNTAIVQNVTKLPQNFTINVDATVGNITSIQNVSQDVSCNQTLWLPTILTTSAATTDSKCEDDGSQAGVSQIIITSDSYVNDSNQAGRRTNILTETSYISRPKPSKVQILSNISIPKNSNYSPQYITQGKEITTPMYGSQNHVYKLSTNVVSQKSVNNSVLCTKPPKGQSLIGCSAIPPVSPIKSVSYSHTFNKSTNLNKTLNKVNNGANLNALVAASTGNTQCHILSRVVSGPNKMSVHSGKKSTTNTFKGKNSQNSGSQKNQSRAIKIIQQAGSANKTDTKPWQVSNVKCQGQSYGNLDSKPSKIIQKVGSPTHKTQPAVLSKPPKGERLILQSPCGPVLISTAPISTSLPKGPHYVQSGSTPNLRYVQTYGPSDNQLSTVSQVSANQQLTAQILQSLSQSKLMVQQNLIPPINNSLTILKDVEEPIEEKPFNQKRIVFGDKSTLLTADDIIGMEERPNLTEELRRYTFQAVAFVMLDHTYALPVQKQPSPPTPPAPITPVPPTPTIVSSPSPQVAPTTPVSPLKRISPVIMSTASYDLPISVPTSVISTSTSSTTPTGTIAYKLQPPPLADDDTASVISSLEGDRKEPQGGSDTETAPEIEEEGKTRCICDFTHDDGYMICCDRCGEWQHVDCMGIDRNNIPDVYMCDLCHPRSVDRRHARNIQLRKREELSALGASDSDSSEFGRAAGRRKRLLTVTTYTNTSGSSVTTYNAAPPVIPVAPQPTLPLPKRGPKRPKKAEVLRKGTKRKLTEKRVKRKKEMLLNRNKYGSGLSNQSHWQDSYELAMTNHYSPELRAKIMKYSSKLGNTPNMASAITAHLCTTVPHAGGKILIATKDLKDNVPIIELRGKYMLSNQHRPQLQNSARSGSQKPGPFVFFYKLPKDSTQICIDTRTYGNEARFARRSCKPNAELQHCIVKGALHVYLVSNGTIQSDTEITVGHDNNGGKQACACGNPKHCKVNGLNPTLSRKSSDYPTREKRSRTRLSSSSSPVSPPPTLPPSTPVKELITPTTPIKSEKKLPIKHEYPPLSPIKTSVITLNFDKPMKADFVEDVKPEIDLLSREEMKPEIDEPDFVKVEPKVESEPELEPELPKPEPEPEKIIEEPEPEPIIEEVKEVKEDSEACSEEEKFEVKPAKIEDKKVKEELETREERPITREFVAKSACHDRSSRSSRTNTCANQDSLDDKTDDSQDKIQTSSKEKDKRKMTREERKMEAIMKAFERMEKAEQRKQEVKERQKRRESDPHPNSMDKDDDDSYNSTKKRKKRKGRARTTSQCNRRRLNSVDSEAATSGDEAPPPPSTRSHLPLHSHTDDTTNDVPSEDIGLSSACLLVEAAVGSVESAFKLPKTKKTMATEWIGRSPERTPSPYQSPYRPTLVSAPSLESLVRVASTMIGDLSGGHDLDHDDDNSRASPPRTPIRDRNRPPKKAKRITRSTPPTEVIETPPALVIPQHSAKKRWLRQAISEESDSPNTVDVFVPESPPSEMVTPLKKRRLARESLSYEQNTTMPCNDETSPNLTSEESPVKEDNNILRQYKVRNIMENMYGRDRTRSDSGQGSDDQCNIDNDILNVHFKGPHDTEHIRRIIGVPTPEEEVPLEILKPDNFKTNNNNVDCDENNYDKVVPMDIETTITYPKIEDTMQHTNMELKDIGSPTDKLNSSQSADTSGNSSPQRDEMDDIQKKIHSFHTENILMLKTRNKKPPKEKRKKVNLNFDLNMVDDQISVQLRTEKNIGCDVHDEGVHENAKIFLSPENIPLPPLETMPVGGIIPFPHDPSPVSAITPTEAIPLPVSPPPTDKRKKVNLNFDLNMVDDQISVQLRKEKNNGTLHDDITSIHDNAKIHVSPVYIPLPMDSIPLPQSPYPRRTLLRSPDINGDDISVNDDTRIHLSPGNIPLPPEQDISGPIIVPEPILLTDEPAMNLRSNRPNSPAVEIVDKRKKVNLNFDLNMVDDQISVQLRTEKRDINGDLQESDSVHDNVKIYVSPEYIPLPPVDSSPTAAKEVETEMEAPIATPVIVTKSVEQPVKEIEKCSEVIDEIVEKSPSVESSVPFSSRFSSPGLFSGIFSNMAQPFNLEKKINENVPNMSIIKSAIDRTTLESGIFDKESRTQVDELKSVQEILTRVNNMDSNNSVLLSGVLKVSGGSVVGPAAPVGGTMGPTGGAVGAAGGSPRPKPYLPRHDPRLNPQPQDKPKPVRRKLSISEYRKRHLCTGPGSGMGAEEAGDVAESEPPASAPAPAPADTQVAARLDAADELEQRLQRDLSTAYITKGVFDAQPTASERQQENLSSRLRREYGLTLPEEEDSRLTTETITPGTGSPENLTIPNALAFSLSKNPLNDIGTSIHLNAVDNNENLATNNPGLKETKANVPSLDRPREDLSSRLKREFGLALTDDVNIPEESNIGYTTVDCNTDNVGYSTLGYNADTVGYTTVSYVPSQNAGHVNMTVSYTSNLSGVNRVYDSRQDSLGYNRRGRGRGWSPRRGKWGRRDVM